MKNSLFKYVINTDEDSKGYYNLGKSDQAKVEHVGAKPAIDVEEPLIFWDAKYKQT